MQPTSMQPNHVTGAATRVASTWALDGSCVEPIGFARGGTAP
jgi:hypothetical protein